MTSLLIPPGRIPAIVYGRISQDPDFTREGVERHVRLCLRRIQESSAWALAPLPGSWKNPADHSAGRWPDGVLVDNNITAAKGQKKTRHEYDRGMKAVDAGDVKVIVSYSQSRLWRERRQRADGFERLAAAKVHLEFIKGASYNFSDATSRMVAEVIGATDQWFAEITAENQRATAADQAERGAYHGKRPFGFDRVPSPGEKRGAERSLIVREHEARYLREAYERADPDGRAESLWQIMKWLDSEGVLTPTGLTWCQAGTASLSLILCAARNIGMREHSEGWSGHGHRPAGKLYPGNWDAVIDDEALFWRVREMLTDPKRRRPGPKTEAQHLLTGFVFCGECDHPMYVMHNRNRPRYHCQNCWTVRGKDQVHAVALQTVFQWMAPGGPFDRAMEQSEPADLQAMRITLESLRKKRREILADYYDEKITREERDFQLARKDAQIADAGARLRQWESELPDVAGGGGGAFTRLWQQWDGEGLAGLEKQRRAIAPLISRVVVYPAGRTNKPSSRLIVIEPGGWAGRLPDPGEVAAPPVPDPEALTPRGKVIAAMRQRPGKWMSRNEVAAATGRADEHQAVLNRMLKLMVRDGVAERAYCRFGTAVENGDQHVAERRAERGGDLRGAGCYGYRLTDGGKVDGDT